MKKFFNFNALYYIMINLLDLDGSEFEFLVAKLLKKMGMKNVVNRRYSKDGGIDVEADEYGLLNVYKIGIQCKRYTPPNKIGVEIIQQLHSAIQSEGFDVGVVITSSTFTKDAINYANKFNIPITLIDGNTLQELIMRYMYSEEEEVNIDLDERKELYHQFKISDRRLSPNENVNEEGVKKEIINENEMQQIDTVCPYCGSNLFDKKLRYCKKCNITFGPPAVSGNVELKSGDKLCPVHLIPLIGDDLYCEQCQWSYNR